MADASKIKTGPCEVFLDGVSVGHTEGDVVVQFGVQRRERLSVRYGESPVDQVRVGQRMTVTFQIAEWTLANVQAWFPEASLSGNTLRFGETPGGKDGDNAKRLVLRPLKAAGESEDIVLYRAVVESVADIGFNSEEDRVVQVTFKGLVDESRADGDLIGYMNVPS